MRTNQEWLNDLQASDSRQAAAVTDLRSLLLRTVLFIFSRNPSDLNSLAYIEVLQLAEDCTQEALIAILNHLADFRGDSQFTTWAYKFAVNTALMAARRERWKGVSLDQISSAEDGEFDWVFEDKSAGTMPDQSVMQANVREMIQQVIEDELTDKQRQVLLLMVFQEMPMDEVVQRLGTNRNAIYKLLHDARRKIKSSLQARGFEVGEMVALFSAPR